MTVQWPVFARAFALAEPVIKADEGFRPAPYICPAGVPSIGYGTTHYPDGTAVTIRDKPITEIEAQLFLEEAGQRFYAELQKPGIITRAPTAHEAGGVLSLAYNIGVGVHDGHTVDLADSTLLRKFNAGDIAGAADQFLAWDKAHVNGQLVTLPGLATRRATERAMFLTADIPVAA